MGTDDDRTTALAARVAAAAATGRPLRIEGGRSKAFYGRAVKGEALSLIAHRGIVNYEPTELVLSARAGTPLIEVEATLAEHGQMLPFEPPHFGGGATLGGAIATGLSGPRRVFAGAARDMVLGTRVINGRGERLRFGGEVMKNVAGYDVSRLMVGALGTLGIITEVSLKVLPAAVAEHSIVLDCPTAKVFGQVEQWRRAGAPVSATAHDGERLIVRLSGTQSGVEAGSRRLGGEPLPEAATWWQRLRDQQLPFFTDDTGLPLWRLALPPGTELPRLDGAWFLEWSGQQLWVRTAVPADAVRDEASRRGGHATLFRGGAPDGEVFQPLEPGIAHFHRTLKQAFDPAGILNPGRLYRSVG